MINLQSPPRAVGYVNSWVYLSESQSGSSELSSSSESPSEPPNNDFIMEETFLTIVSVIWLTNFLKSASIRTIFNLLKSWSAEDSKIKS